MERVTFDADALAAARDLLDAAGYAPAALAERLGTGSSLRLQAPDVARARFQLRPDRALDVLALLFLLGDEVDATAALSPRDAQTLVGAGLAETAGERLRPLVQLVPHDDLVVASDVPVAEPAGDFVPGVQAPSDLLARLTPRDRVRRALDVGTGNGIQALLLARHADTVVATDVSPRALAFAGANAALNRVTNVELRLGELLEPVAGERFDLVVANPPYVISPEHAFVFRDAAGRGDELVRALAREMPAVLADDGLAVVLASWVVSESEPGPPGWTADSACGRLLFASRVESPAQAAHAWNKDRVTDREMYEERVRRWLAFYAAGGIDAIGYGALVIARMGAGQTPWEATVAAPLDGRGPAGPHVRRLVASHAALAAAGGRTEAVGRLVLAPDAEIIERRRRGAGGLETHGVEIRLSGGIGTAAELDPGGAFLADAFERPRTAGEAIEIAARRLRIDPAEIEESAIGVVGSMLVNGFLELAR